MSFNVHILNASKELTVFETRIINLTSNAEIILSKHMNFAGFTTDLVIKSGKYVVPEVGIGAYCVNQYEIQMALDITNDYLLKSFDDNFIATLAHETHHACRESTVGYGKSLFDAMILEGLACHFEEEIGYKRPVYVEHLQPDVRQFYLSKAKIEWSKDTFDYNEWFLGNKQKDMPKWIGYDVGYHLVGLYLQQTHKSAGECYDHPSAIILELLSDKGYLS
ncbi:DUF2268 domain-containing putative Zn-dependent protease [Psychrobacter sp.]|uniref:DUF2268 domain-containing putative Zn-dependent protease n=1 Tax=Psychrobacter sp. TaxID=56811 RepID=UPI0025E25E05|nr:DUF2268 domain-containing putative Zn-dependent protease [Psychrobacter sp.]